MKSNLKYLSHKNIDFNKWDLCVGEAINSRIYANSWFLDRAAVDWDALVYGDYEYVMPLPVRIKLGIRYLYQPLYCQQLGIFPPPPPEVAVAYFEDLQHRFSYMDIQLNSSNLPVRDLKGVGFTGRKNFLLPVGAEYHAIEAAYSTNTRRNLSKAGAGRLSYAEGIPMEAYLDFKQQNLPVKISKEGMQKLKSIIAYCLYKGIGEIEGVYSADNNLCAAVFFCRWKERVIYMNAVSSEAGKESRAMFFLIDRFIQSVAGQDIAIDFEGSMIPGIARFFEGFGAAPEVYYQVKYNRLPAILSWIKKITE
jgi:hypothetical protein